MITFATTTQPDIVSYTIDGTFDGRKVNEVVSRIKETADRQGKIRLLGVIKSLDGITNLAGVFKNFGHQLGLIRQVEKYAIMTDKKWLSTLANIEGFFVPNMDVKTFSLDQRERAMQWLSKPTADATRNVTSLDVAGEHALGIRIAGTLGRADYDFINQRIDTQLMQGGDDEDELRLLIQVADFDGFTLRGFWEDIKSEVKYYSRIEKVALVTEKDLSTVVNVADFITPGLEMKYFPGSQLEAAKTWLR
ncbi:STAS/SEC14 domain-containing protein [Neolewinella sp.]|uniref:STAS/SEC14 domain-containing protein n=1 Tax=Neolewinella sp. TaxID=2993543 RepID=UPI003B52BD0F